jgi:hypothetical protein
MTNPPSVQRLMQSLGVIIISIPSHFTNKLTAITTIGDFFTFQEERLRNIEGKVVQLERRVNDLEVKDNGCSCSKN